MWNKGILRILYESVRVELQQEYNWQTRTMATLRPKWFLISPALMASGACSSMSWKRCLIPIMARYMFDRVDETIRYNEVWKGCGKKMSDPESKW